VTEPTSHVELEIQRRIQAQRVRIQAARQRRDELSAARRRGLAARHANKLRRLAEAEQRAQQRADEPDLDDDDQDDGGAHHAPSPREQEPKLPVRVELCPHCRQERLCRVLSAVQVEGHRMLLVRCPEARCGLAWAVQPDQRPVLIAA
jgi:hypothetical protein